ncbi:bifunctional 2-polyprenyl-6-hydroxyphenol methylase/3-demethylubiquinol 3-O-methyltransferase UbiG [Thiolapillus sp.]|uniref:bifunctional 2-polyprenyl-6-hydroxyphenol methylase/3-demethylubiquinol 3-O-methyltransferase UbiG n=2 Tax=Thiolapillus sp. TaxID=2017437 RepID=UPI003AF74866
MTPSDINGKPIMPDHAHHNVDPSEISKFEELASRWWDPNSEFKPLHEINPLRLGYIEQHAGGLADRKVLDVGCGGGILAESMAEKGAHVTGIDMGDANLEVARLHLLESGRDVDYRQIPVEKLAREMPREFDVVTCMEMLEHVPDPSSIVTACATLVKPGGTVFFSTINRNPKSYLFAIVGAEYVLHLLPKGTHDYARFIRPSELSRWIRQTDLEMQDISGMTYNPLTRVYRLDPSDVDVNYLVATQKTAE